MICRVCGGAMELDALVVGDAVRGLDPDQTVPIVLRCLNGHSARLSQVRRGVHAVPSRLIPRCAVCGIEVPRRPGAASRKSCGREHANFIERKRSLAAKLHHATGAGPFTFLIEAQPWYQGAYVAFQPKVQRPTLVPTAWPIFPEIPAAWLDGFRSVYQELNTPPPLTIFPELEAERLPVRAPTRRYRRRKPVTARRREQLMPYPVPR